MRMITNIFNSQLKNVLYTISINRYRTFIVIRHNCTDISKTNNSVNIYTDTLPQITEYNLKQIQSSEAWDKAFTSLLSNLNNLQLPSISSILKQCGIFIYRLKKYEKYDFSQNNQHRLRLLDALVNSIITRIGGKVIEINDQTAGFFTEILKFFSKNYYQSAYQIYQTLENDFKQLRIKDMQLKLDFITSLTDFTLVYGMMSNDWMDRTISEFVIKNSNKLTIPNIAQLLHIISTKMNLQPFIIDNIVDTTLSLLTSAEINPNKHMVTHTTLSVLFYNLAKLYKLNPSEKQFSLQKRLLELYNLGYGVCNFTKMSQGNLNKAISSLHKMLVIGLLHDREDNIGLCINILKKITLSLLDKLSDDPRVIQDNKDEPFSVKCLIMLNNINYLAQNIASSSFALHFNKLLNKIAIAWNNEEIKIDGTYSCALLINILKSKATRSHVKSLLSLIAKCNWNELSAAELNSIIQCLISLRKRNLIDSLESIIPSFRNYNILQLDTMIDLSGEGIIEDNLFLSLLEHNLDKLNSGQLSRLKTQLTAMNNSAAKILLDKILSIAKSETKNLAFENQVDLASNLHKNKPTDELSDDLKLKAIRSAKRLGLPLIKF